MKKCSFFCAGWWPFLLFPLLLLLLFALFQWRSVEQDVVNNAQTTLDKSELSWAKVETFNRGREVLVTGLAPSEEGRSDIENQLLTSEGVNSVSFADGIAEPVALRAPEVTANWLGGKIVLNGELPNQASIDLLVNEAQAAYGSARVVNQLQLSNTVENMTSTKGLFSGLGGLTDGAQISISNSEITLNGDVESNQVKTNIGSKVSTVFSGTVNNLLSVVAPVVAPVAPPVDYAKQCKSQLDELLSATSIVFNVGKSTINAQSDNLLNDIAKTTNNCPDASFEVAGHTDSSGNLASNMLLSQQRAQAVVNRLIELGLNSNRFTIEGYGPNRPIMDNSTAEGRAKNRRIEFNIKN